nr:hypothetical protein [Frondihabitans sucicola]
MNVLVPGERHQGYVHALAEAGIEAIPEWSPNGEFTFAGGHDSMKRLLCGSSSRRRCSRPPTRWRSARCSRFGRPGCECRRTSRSSGSTGTPTARRSV